MISIMWARIAICSLACAMITSGGAQASSPWKPQVTVEAFERPGGIRLRLRPKVLERFKDAWRKGRRLLDLGQYRMAQPLLQRATRLNPDHVGARLAHARTLLTLGYLHWNRALIRKASDDVRHALWLRPAESGLIQLAALLEHLQRRMKRVPSRKAKKRS